MKSTKNHNPRRTPHPNMGGQHPQHPKSEPLKQPLTGQNSIGKIQSPKRGSKPKTQLKAQTHANTKRTNGQQNVVHMPPQFHEIQLTVDGKQEIIKTAICFTCLTPWIWHTQDQKCGKCGAFDALNYQCVLCEQINFLITEYCIECNEIICEICFAKDVSAHQLKVANKINVTVCSTECKEEIHAKATDKQNWSTCKWCQKTDAIVFKCEICEGPTHKGCGNNSTS